MPIPSIYMRDASGVHMSDPATELYSKRVVWLVGEVSDESVMPAILQLSYLDSAGEGPIHLYVNSQGGSVSSGLALIDCMRGLRNPVHTHAFGLAASMGTTILACGQRGFRTATPNSRILVHQPLAGGIGGQATDIEIAVKNLTDTKAQLEGLLAEACGTSAEKVRAATDRDNWMTPQQAMDFCLIDGIEASWMDFARGEAFW